MHLECVVCGWDTGVSATQARAAGRSLPPLCPPGDGVQFVGHVDELLGTTGATLEVDGALAGAHLKGGLGQVAHGAEHKLVNEAIQVRLQGAGLVLAIHNRAFRLNNKPQQQPEAAHFVCQYSSHPKPLYCLSYIHTHLWVPS